MSSVNKLIKVIQEHLTDDLRKEKYRGHPNYLKGHCYIASEAFLHLYAGRRKWTPGTINHEGETHWILKDKKNDVVVDITAEQFKKYLRMKNLEVEVF